MPGNTLKTPSTPVPQSKAEAGRLLGEVGTLQIDLDLLRLAEEEAIKKLKEDGKAERRPVEAKIKTKFAALFKYAEANKQELLSGGKRSVPFAVGAIGWRWNPPSVTIKADNLEAVIAALKANSLDGLIRTTEEVDKEAVLKDPALIENIDGISVSQVEYFFAKPREAKTDWQKQAQKLTGPDAKITPDN